MFCDLAPSRLLACLIAVTYLLELYEPVLPSKFTHTQLISALDRAGQHATLQSRNYSMPHWQNTEVTADGEHGITKIKAQPSHTITIRDPTSQSKKEGSVAVLACSWYLCSPVACCSFAMLQELLVQHA